MLSTDYVVSVYPDPLKYNSSSSSDSENPRGICNSMVKGFILTR